MNLFWLAKLVRKGRLRGYQSMMRSSARQHIDKHVVKMPLEAVQLAYTAMCILCPEQEWRKAAPFNKSGTMRGYLATHKDGRFAKWVAASRTNFMLCLEYALALCREYTRRYGKEHFVQHHAEWLLKAAPINLPNIPMTPIPISGTEVNHVPSIHEAVQRYRAIYIQEKLALGGYRKPGRVPKWARKQTRLKLNNL